MLGLENNVSIFATIFGIISVIGGAAGYFKSSRGDSIIKYQGIEINLRDEKIADLEKTVAAITESNKELVKHNEYLQKLGQGSPQLIELTEAIKNQTEIINKLISTEGKNGRIRKSK